MSVRTYVCTYVCTYIPTRADTLTHWQPTSPLDSRDQCLRKILLAIESDFESFFASADADAAAADVFFSL